MGQRMDALKSVCVCVCVCVCVLRGEGGLEPPYELRILFNVRFLLVCIVNTLEQFVFLFSIKI